MVRDRILHVLSHDLTRAPEEELFDRMEAPAAAAVRKAVRSAWSRRARSPASCCGQLANIFQQRCARAHFLSVERVRASVSQCCAPATFFFPARARPGRGSTSPLNLVPSFNKIAGSSAIAASTLGSGPSPCNEACHWYRHGATGEQRGAAIFDWGGEGRLQRRPLGSQAASRAVVPESRYRIRGQELRDEAGDILYAYEVFFGWLQGDQCFSDSAAKIRVRGEIESWLFARRRQKLSAEKKRDMIIMEMGVGIHGEPGRRREKLASANEIVDELLEAVVSDLPFGRGDDVALMINGLGGTPISELYLLYGYAHEQLAQRGINVRRNYVGEYCTSLDMAGTSITLSRLDQEIAELLAAPAEIAIRTF